MDDLERLKNEYAQREKRFAESEIYSPFTPAQLFLLQGRQRDLLRLLAQGGLRSLEGQRILEVGCGGGNVLQDYLWAGARAENLHGTELIYARARAARRVSAQLPISNADGQALPYAADSFDLVAQYTVFSSILDDGINARIAREMLRVLKPGGLVVWYDFWLNPTNPQARGIRPGEVRRYFPGCQYRFKRITLAPPIARRLVRFSWTLATVLESLKVFNSHYIAIIRKG